MSVWIDTSLILIPALDWYRYYEPNKWELFKAKISFSKELFVHPELKHIKQKCFDKNYQIYYFNSEDYIEHNKHPLFKDSIFFFDPDRIRYINMTDSRVAYTITNKNLKTNTRVVVDNLFDAINNMEYI